MSIDFTTNVGKVRLRVGDIRDIPWLPDEVYEQTLVDTNDNLSKSAQICAQYILALLANGVHTKLAQIESYDNQAFDQYKQFIILTVSNPAFMNVTPILSGGGTNCVNPLIQFSKSWNAGYVAGTSQEDMDAYAGVMSGCYPCVNDVIVP